MSLSRPDHSLDGQSTSEMTIALSAALGFLCTVVVGARLYTRAILLRNAGRDDVSIVITQIFATGLNLATILEAHYGVGKHSWVTGPEDSIRQLQCLFSAIELYIWALCLVKVSLLLQYQRIFLAVWLHRAAYCIIGFAVTWNIIQSFLVAFACTPMSVLYPSMAHNCFDSLTVWYIAAGINITTDFVVFLLPIPLINSLQLPLRQKVLLYMVFGLGFFTCVISIVRATTLYLVVGRDDPSWYGARASTWSMVEVNCAILCSCLPTIRYLVALIFPCLGLRTQASRYGPGSIPGGSGTRSRKTLRGGFILRSWKHKQTLGSEDPPASDNTAGEASGPVMPEGRHEPADILETRWGIDVEKNGLYYHSNHISAWVSANPDSVSGTNPRQRSEDEGSERRLVGHAASERDIGRHILITKSTVVQEGRVDDPCSISLGSRKCSQS